MDIQKELLEARLRSLGDQALLSLKLMTPDYDGLSWTDAPPLNSLKTGGRVQFLATDWLKVSNFETQLNSFRPWIKNSFFMRLQEGGNVPPHRVLDNTFRLIAFFNSISDSLHFLLNDKLFKFNSNHLYFLNSKLPQSLFSFSNDNYVLLLDVEYSEESVHLINEKLMIY